MKPLHILLHDLRVKKEVKQETIAKMIGTTQQQYSKYEMGKRDLPLRVLPILADFFDVSADFLIGRKGDYFNVPGLEQMVTKTKSAKDMVVDVMALDAEGRSFVLECIHLQQIKEEHYRQKEKTEEQ